MKTTREKADELILSLLPKNHDFKDFLHAKKCAILSVKHTISILQLALDNQAMHNDDYNVLEQLENQQSLLTELESRL